LLIGPELREDGAQAVRFLSAPYASQTSLWYGSIRAIGFKAEAANSFLTPWRSLQIDFNQMLPMGAAARFDSGAAAIRVGTAVFQAIRQAMPSSCEPSGGPDNPHPSLECPCPEERDLEDFPTITLSFEASGNFHILGLDMGAEHMTCIPPSAYVVRVGETCKVAIVDGGAHHAAFGNEAVVLGVPFFRAMDVGYDARSRQVAIAAMDSDGGPQCVCSDPKNWLIPGKRLSGRRVFLSLGMVAAMAVYVFLVHSPSPVADQLRMRLGGLAAAACDRWHNRVRLGGGDGSASMGAGGARRLAGRSATSRSPGGVQLPDLADQSSFVAMVSDTEDQR